MFSLKLGTLVLVLSTQAWSAPKVDARAKAYNVCLQKQISSLKDVSKLLTKISKIEKAKEKVNLIDAKTPYDLVPMIDFPLALDMSKDTQRNFLKNEDPDKATTDYGKSLLHGKRSLELSILSLDIETSIIHLERSVDIFNRENLSEDFYLDNFETIRSIEKMRAEDMGNYENRLSEFGLYKELDSCFY